MKMKNLVIVGALVLALVLGSVALVSAGTGNGTSGFGGRLKSAFERGFKLGVKYNMNEDVANFLGVTVDELRNELQSGKSLATIATEHGKSETDLVNFIVTKEKAYLEDALKNGKITQDQYDKMIANLETRVKERVESVPPTKEQLKNAFKKGFRKGVKFGMNEDIANYLGLTLDQLKAELQSGKSLAAIATEHGKSETDLVNFIVTKEKAFLDTALKNGKITQDQYNKMLSNLEARVKERVEKVPPVKNPNP
jgi:ubiquinone biosynthesis protein COQ9